VPPLRVGLLAYGLDRPLSGISRYALELTRALARMTGGPELVLLAASPVGPLAELGLPVIKLRASRRLPGLMTAGNVMIPLAARRAGLDIVHDMTGVTPFALGGGGASRVVSVHDVIPLSFGGVSSRLDSLIYRRWLPSQLPRVEQVITISEHSRADIAKHLRVPLEHIAVTPLAASSRFEPATPAAIADVRARFALPEHYLLYLGSIEERKNLRRVLEALAVLNQRGGAPRFVITGEMKWQYSGILETLERLQLYDLITMTGYVPEADLPALYTGALGLVFPSLYEGFGLPLLEAMNCGTPVITSTAASLPEVVGSAALLVDPYSVEAIANAMHSVVESESLRDRLRQAGLARARAFTWDRTAALTVAAYELAMGRRKIARER